MQYTNGSYQISLDFETGTKIRTLAEEADPRPMQPETFDLKVTDFCNAGCSWCHEESTVRGQHGALEPLLEALSPLRPGFEVAIGGGDPMRWPALDSFLLWVADKGGVANITVNGLHIQKAAPRLRAFQERKLICGIGVSAIRRGDLFSSAFNLAPDLYGLRRVVGHVILGGADKHNLLYSLGQNNLHKPPPLLDSYLLLGAKHFGRGAKAFKAAEDPRWTFTIPQEVNLLLRFSRRKGFSLSFDNLALEQGLVQRQVTEEVWEQHYMGEDGQFSMYVDAVRQQWARTSTAPHASRVSWKDQSIVDFFNAQRKE